MITFNFDGVACLIGASSDRATQQQSDYQEEEEGD
jgi:hypothetical protein